VVVVGLGILELQEVLAVLVVAVKVGIEAKTVLLVLQTLVVVVVVLVYTQILEETVALELQLYVIQLRFNHVSFC
jgi:hypothetical protein